MNIIGCTLIALLSLPAFARDESRACETRLTTLVEEVRHRIEFDQNSPILPPDEYSEIQIWVARYGVHVVPDDQGHFNAMAFDTREGHLDRAFLMEGRLSDDAFVVQKVMTQKKGYDHFKRLAQVRNVKPIEIPLRRRFMNCPSLKISGSAQIKLLMKHRLELTDVIDFIEVSRAKPTRQPERNRGGMRYTLDDVDQDARNIRVVVSHDGHCPNELITAYQIH